MIVLSRESGNLSLYEQLYRQLKQEIVSNHRKAGEKMPSKRIMAQDLKISVNTVDAAYQQLESEGYILAKPKSGFYVCSIEQLDLSQKSEPIRTRAVPQADPVQVDFAPGGIAQDKFPLRRWQQLLRSCAELPAILRRTPSQGDYGLRCAIADYLYRARGAHCQPENIIIGAGTDSLLSCLSYLLPNACVFAVENPVYNRAYEIFERMGHRTVPVEVDHSGVIVPQIDAYRQAILYTTPSHQYPLGICMPMGRRVQLLNWCGHEPLRYVIEDDYDSEFRYDARPIPSLQSIDCNGRVIYLGTFSRSIAPGLRISYMVLPDTLMARYREVYQNFSSSVSSLEQAVLREFILQGDFERHLNRMRAYYKGQRTFFLQQLTSLGTTIEPIGEAAGHHLAVRVSNGMDEQTLCVNALQKGARVYPISKFFIGKMPEKYHGKVLLGFGGLSRDEITQGVSILGQAWL